MTTIGHAGAVRRLRSSHPDAEAAKAVAMVAVTNSSLWCGKRGIEKGVTYLLALFGGRLVLMHPTRNPQPEAMLAEFAKKTYRIGEVSTDTLNISFVLSRPYGAIHLRMLRRAMYAVNTEVMEMLTASAAAAEKVAARTERPPLQTAGDVTVFARMCAAYGPGAEAATAVAEARVLGGSAKKGLLATRPELLLATFPDRLVLLDRNETTHVGRPPVAEFPLGSEIAVTEDAKKHVDLTLASPGKAEQLALRVSRYGEDRIDALVLDAVLGIASA